MKKLLVTMLVAIAVGVPVAGAGVVLAASGTLPIGAPWGGADQVGAPLDRHVKVSYRINAGRNTPQAALDAVQDAIDAWNAGIDGRQSGWAFDLVEFTGARRTKPDIDIRLKRGGGVIAGQALSKFDREEGFRTGVKITISGSAFGFANEPATVKEITMHEVGHALALGHHSNEDDLMGPTVGKINGARITEISDCDLDGFEAAHQWLTDKTAGVPELNLENSIDCL